MNGTSPTGRECVWCDGCDGKTPSMASKVWEQTLTQDRTVLLKPDARFPPDFFSFVFLLGRSASEPLGDFFFFFFLGPPLATQSSRMLRGFSRSVRKRAYIILQLSTRSTHLSFSLLGKTVWKEHSLSVVIEEICDSVRVEITVSCEIDGL